MVKEVIKVLKDLAVMHSTVGGLKEAVTRLADKVESHSRQLIELKSREDFLVERMKNEAIQAVAKMTSEYSTRLSDLEHRSRPRPKGLK